MVVLYDTGYAMVSASFQNLYSKKLRSEEHTSELQSRQYLVCRLLLEKKKKKKKKQKNKNNKVDQRTQTT